MVNYACAFSQSELGKYFEWIILNLNESSSIVILIYFNFYYHWVECFELLCKYVLLKCTGLTKAICFSLMKFGLPLWRCSFLFAHVQLRNDAFCLHLTHTEVLNLIRGWPFNSWGGGGWFWKKISCKRLSEEKNCMQHKCNRKLMGKKGKKYPAHQIARKKILDDQKSLKTIKTNKKNLKNKWRVNII